MSSFQGSKRLAWVLATAWLASCSEGSPPVGPEPDPILGVYRASILSVTTPSQTIDVLASGGSLSMALAENGTTSGRLLVPGGGENGQTLDADMAGTWSRTGNVVRFTQTADTFVRDGSWAVETGSLRTTLVSGGTVVTAVLLKE